MIQKLHTLPFMVYMLLFIEIQLNFRSEQKFCGDDMILRVLS